MQAQLSADLMRRLTTVLTAWDRKQSKRQGYNIYALGIYLERAEDVVADVAAGIEISESITRNFNDRLRDYLLAAMVEG